MERGEPMPDRLSKRAAILRASRVLFASEGYELASVRAVARAAAVDPALVEYYFHSKRQLFEAAAAPVRDAVRRLDESLQGDLPDPGASFVSELWRLLEEDDGRVAVAVLVRAVCGRPVERRTVHLLTGGGWPPPAVGTPGTRAALAAQVAAVYASWAAARSTSPDVRRDVVLAGAVAVRAVLQRATRPPA